MAAPALKPCPVCRGTDAFLAEDDADCGLVQWTCWACHFSTGLHLNAEHSADAWNRLSDLAQARTRAAVREALEEAVGSVMKLYRPAGSEVEVDRNWDRNTEVMEAVEAIRAQIARLDAAPSAQPEGGADAG